VIDIEIEKVACKVIGETELAYQLQEKHPDPREAWFPKSEVSFARRNIKTGDAVAEIPLWLLEAEGWEA
jgi:hypothetical protein